MGVDGAQVAAAPPAGTSPPAPPRWEGGETVAGRRPARSTSGSLKVRTIKPEGPTRTPAAASDPFGSLDRRLPGRPGGGRGAAPVPTPSEDPETVYAWMMGLAISVGILIGVIFALVALTYLA